MLINDRTKASAFENKVLSNEIKNRSKDIGFNVCPKEERTKNIGIIRGGC